MAYKLTLTEDFIRLSLLKRGLAPFISSTEVARGFDAVLLWNSSTR
jgi:hypothetical protein